VRVKADVDVGVGVGVGVGVDVGVGVGVGAGVGIGLKFAVREPGPLGFHDVVALVEELIPMGPLLDQLTKV
jgi:hypothetical protein